MRSCSVAGCTKPHRARGMCSTHYNRERYAPEQRHHRATVMCQVCGVSIQRYLGKGYRHVCSVACRTALIGGTPHEWTDWAQDAEARARRAGALIVDHFDRVEIYERDGYACQICSLPVDMATDPLNRYAPSIDHVVPLSRGGAHSRANVRTTHYGCNSAIGNRGSLRLSP